MRWSKEEKIYRIILSILTVLTVSHLLTDAFFSEISYREIFAAIAIPLLFLTAFSIVRIRGRIFLSVFVALSMWLLFYLLDRATVETLFTQFSSWLREGMPTIHPQEIAKEGMSNPADGSLEGLPVFYGIWCARLFLFVAAWPFGILGMLLARFRILRIGLFFGIVGFMVLNLFTKWKLSEGSAVLILGLSILFLVEWIQERKWRSRHNDGIGKCVAVLLTPFLALYIIVLWVVPTNHKPYEWQLFQNIWAQINQGRIWFSHNWGIGTNDDFSMSFVGDDEQAKIGSAVISSNRTRLYVSRSTGGRGAIYLGATYYNSFEVDGWEYTVTKEEDSPKIDAMESFYAVLRYGSHETSDLLRHSSLTITHEELKTRHIFAPIKTITVETAANLPILASKSGYVFTKARGLGTKYDISYYRLNVGNPIFTEFLEEESTHAYGNTNVSLEDQDALRRTLQHFGATADDFSEEILLERVYSIKESYGEAPTLTPGVASYFEEVVSGAKTTLEALRLLEQELGTYTYTTAPGKIPDGEDFLEYFLLESKQGYCTYFASAFVLLARHIGLPARFVQGFCVPNVASDNGMYEVTSRMAHAWPEVYFEGVGWIAFEPTPGFYVYRNQRWEVLIQEEKVDLGQPIAPLPIATEPEEPSDETSEEAVEEEPQDVRVPIERILLLFLGLVLTAVLIYSFDVIVSRRRYRRYNLSQKILYQTERILRLLECFGQSPKPSDTIHEICAWLEQSTLPKETIDFLKVYESIRYGNQAENEQDLEKATLAVTLLLHELKLQHRMSYYRFVLLHTSSRNYVLQKGKE